MCWKLLLCCLDINIAPEVWIEYNDFMKAAASQSTCLLDPGDLKTKFWGCIYL